MACEYRSISSHSKPKPYSLDCSSSRFSISGSANRFMRTATVNHPSVPSMFLLFFSPILPPVKISE